ncbi:fungal-specific transcription factor domain-containing protein [Cercophora scortea]|uniref:Fungal-specific transcription factor domain-containing protein n=1 Tax=Cercophora scortea TaxID=314031 RepID=A0AAE0I788_9PEZI|nr:fungal-specific transcription factor domain-containing protein [Cercophora scortea]
MNMEAARPEEREPGGPELSAPEYKKRNRIRFSCTTCRDKKLKCNRMSPCDQCEKRHITATCHFVPYVNARPGPGPGLLNQGNGSETRSAVHMTLTCVSHSGPSAAAALPGPRTKPPPSDTNMQARLKHLERLVQVLKSQRRENHEVPYVEPASSLSILDSQGQSIAELKATDYESRCTELKKTHGVLVGDYRYVDAANWEAILDEITKLTNDLKAAEDSYGEPDQLQPIDPSLRYNKNAGPVLLVGNFPHATQAEMVARMPPRHVADRLIARFFQTKDPAWMMFHIPSFIGDYDKYWENPAAVSYTWIGLVFLMFSHAAMFCLRGDEDVPGNLGTPLEVMEAYKVLGAQCLALDDYTKPGRYKVEALLLYFGVEYLRQNEAFLGTSILLSVIIRLAMHSGLHRDPQHYPDISPLAGETRRRVWTLLVEVDRLVSFQFGLPSNINPIFYDTELPHNIHDHEIGPDTKELPQSRPETERTVVLFTIVKSRLMDAFGEITSAISQRKPILHSELVRLDKRLEAAHDSFPPDLRYRSFSLSLADSTEIIMERYCLELLYQKSRTVLHRKYMGAGRLEERYVHSRRTCLDAATKTLKHQYDIHCEIQPGGRLPKDAWFLTSLSVHDFLLADMILCLEITYLNAQMKSPDASAKAVEAFAVDKSSEIMSKEQLMSILRTSRSIWQTTRNVSAEANRAFLILSKMLSVTTGDDFDTSPESNDNSNAQNTVDFSQPAPCQLGLDKGSNIPSLAPSLAGSWTGISPQAPFSNTPAGSLSNSTGQDSAQFPASWDGEFSGLGSTEIPSLSVVDDVIDPIFCDWTLWDNQVQNSSAEMMQIPWDSFFQTNANFQGP